MSTWESITLNFGDRPARLDRGTRTPARPAPKQPDRAKRANRAERLEMAIGASVYSTNAQGRDLSRIQHEPLMEVAGGPGDERQRAEEDVSR
jgi:hypothetical protein